MGEHRLVEKPIGRRGLFASALAGALLRPLGVPSPATAAAPEAPPQPVEPGRRQIRVENPADRRQYVILDRP